MIIPRSDGVVTNRETSAGLSSQATSFAVTAANGAMNLANQWNQQRDQAKLQEALNNAIKKKTEWKAANLTREGKAAEGLTEDYLKFSQETENELAKDLTGPVRDQFMNWSLRDTESDKLSVMMHQKKQEDFVKQSTFNEGVNLANETIRLDAKNWQKGFEHLTNSLELAKTSGVIPEEKFEQVKTEYSNKFRSELGKAYYTQDKHEFIKNIDQFGFGKPEIAAYKEKYQDDLRAEEREKKSLYAEEMRALRSDKENMIAQAVANGDTSFLVKAAEKADSMGYKLEAKDFLEEAKTYDKVIGFNSKNRNAPLSDLKQQADSLSVPTSLDGANAELKANIAIKKEVDKKLKAFDTDPAKFVQAWAIGNSKEEIADSMLSIQKSQGVMPKKGYQILTVEEKNLSKNIWEDGSVDDRTNLVMKSLEYGKHAPKVLEEMGINTAVSLSPLLLKDGNEKDIRLLVAGVSHKPEVLDDATKSDYRLAAKETELYQHLTKVQSRFPANGDLPQRLSQMEKAIMGVSAVKVNPEAGKEFFDERIATMDEGDKLIYFPKSMDEDELSSYLDQKKMEVQNTLFKGDNSRKVKMAMRNAIWVNSDNGFMLADETTGKAIPGSEVNFLETDPGRKDFISNTTKKFKEAQDRKDIMTSTFIRR